MTSDRWAEVDLSAIRYNCKNLISHCGSKAKLIAVVKADAYGHGAKQVACAALAGGAHMVAVNTSTEALTLSADIPGDKILMLGPFFEDDVRELVQKRVVFSCFDMERLLLLEAATKGVAARTRLHVKVDTGMSRYGANYDEALKICEYVANSLYLELDGVYTHFATADLDDDSYCREQFHVFKRFLSDLESKGIRPRIRHCANTAAAIRFPEMVLDGIRCGIAVYGYTPCKPRAGLELKPALSVRARVGMIKNIAAGTGVGYGRTWIATKERRIATITMGYADGVSWSRSNKGFVIIQGRKAPLIGRVSMDAISVDISEIEGVKVGDVVTLIGEDNGERIWADEVAQWSGTIVYEVLTSLGSRVLRIYKN